MDGKMLDDQERVHKDEDEQIPASTVAVDPILPTNNDTNNSNNISINSSNVKSTDILKRILSFSKLKTPAASPVPPRFGLQRAPSSLRSVSEEDITALPQIPLSAALALPVPEAVENPQRSYKGVRRVFTYRTLLRGRVAE